MTNQLLPLNMYQQLNISRALMLDLLRYFTYDDWPPEQGAYIVGVMDRTLGILLRSDPEEEAIFRERLQQHSTWNVAYRAGLNGEDLP